MATPRKIKPYSGSYFACIADAISNRNLTIYCSHNRGAINTRNRFYAFRTSMLNSPQISARFKQQLRETTFSVTGLQLRITYNGRNTNSRAARALAKISSGNRLNNAGNV